MSKDTKNAEFSMNSAIPVNSGKVNSYGLDLSNPTIINFSFKNIKIDILDFRMDSILSSLMCSLIVRNLNNPNPKYTSHVQNIDLFNSGAMDYHLKKVSQNSQIPSSELEDAISILSDRLIKYKASGSIQKSTTNDKVVEKEVTRILKGKCILNEVRKQFENAKISSPEIAMQLFLISLTRNLTHPIHINLVGNKSALDDFIEEFLEYFPDEQRKVFTSLEDKPFKNQISGHLDSMVVQVKNFDRCLNKNSSSIIEYIENGYINTLATNKNRLGNYESNFKCIKSPFILLGSSYEFIEKVDSQYFIQLDCSSYQSSNQSYYNRVISGYSIESNDKSFEKEIIKEIQRRFVAKKTVLIEEKFNQLELSSVLDDNRAKFAQILTMSSIVCLVNNINKPVFTDNGTPYYKIENRDILEVFNLFQSYWIQERESLSSSLQDTLDKLICYSTKRSKQFKLIDVQKEVGINYNTLNAHIKLLKKKRYVQKVAGNQKTGYVYSLLKKDSRSQKQIQIERFLNQLSN